MGFSVKTRRSKYNAIPATVGDRRFHSQKEAGRYIELKILQDASLIRDLQCQVTFRLTAHGIHICRYVADFTYYEAGSDALVVEDAKGFRTEAYKLKAKLFAAEYRFPIREV